MLWAVKAAGGIIPIQTEAVPYDIPFFSNTLQHNFLQDDLHQALDQVITGGQFIRGTNVAQLERQFGERLGVPYAVGVGNGTDALWLSIQALEIGDNAEIITPAWSWISTASAITRAGAKPIFADVDPIYYTLTVEAVEPLITSKTKAVIAVHLYGASAPIRDLQRFCSGRRLHLIEDCAQGILTSEGGVVAGRRGICSAFSFYPTKNLGALGDAGLVTTSNASIAERIRRLSNHGALTRNDHILEGVNSRLDELQAAFLIVKLSHLAKWTEQRKVAAQYYTKNLAGIDDLHLPQTRPGTNHTFHLFVIRTSRRNELKEFLEGRGIQTLIHYPTALPFLPPYASANKDREFPVSGGLQNEVLSLPLYPELKKDDQDLVIEAVRDYYCG